MAYSPSTLFVSFDANESEVLELLRAYNLFGTKVSNVVQRYAVEVPYGEEEKFRNIFSQNSLVLYVGSSILRGSLREPRPKKKEENVKKRTF